MSVNNSADKYLRLLLGDIFVSTPNSNFTSFFLGRVFEVSKIISVSSDKECLLWRDIIFILIYQNGNKINIKFLRELLFFSWFQFFLFFFNSLIFFLFLLSFKTPISASKPSISSAIHLFFLSSSLFLLNSLFKVFASVCTASLFSSSSFIFFSISSLFKLSSIFKSLNTSFLFASGFLRSFLCF